MNLNLTRKLKILYWERQCTHVSLWCSPAKLFAAHSKDALATALYFSVYLISKSFGSLKSYLKLDSKKRLTVEKLRVCVLLTQIVKMNITTKSENNPSITSVYRIMKRQKKNKKIGDTILNCFSWQWYKRFYKFSTSLKLCTKQTARTFFFTNSTFFQLNQFKGCTGDRQK